MTLSTGPNLGQLEDGAPGESHYTELMRQWRAVDALIQPSVISRVASLPTSGQVNGDRYLLTATANVNKIARWTTRLGVAAWEYFTAKDGWSVWSTADQKGYRFSGSPLAWSEEATGGSGGMTNPMTTPADLIVGGASGAPTRLAKGAALQVLRVNAAGTALEYADESGGGGGGLTDITEGKNTASPNATVSVVALKNSATEANSDIAIIPKGSGAFLAAVPDDTSSGGGKRGINAVDLQTSRTNYNQVASGDKSVIVGGSACRAAGSHSIAGGGLAVATGIYSIALGGYSPSATGQWSVTIGGSYNSASADFATVIGGASLTASNTNSTTVGGEGNDSSGAFASVCGGAYAIARGYGAEARASGRFSATGDAQRERYILRRPTSSATPLELSANAAAKNASNQVVLQNNSAYAFSGKIVARSSSDSAAFSISGLITRGASAAATAFVGTPVVTLIAASAGASAWSISLSANTDYGCLVIQATGAASTNIKWVADVETVEVVG